MSKVVKGYKKFSSTPKVSEGRRIVGYVVLSGLLCVAQPKISFPSCKSQYMVYN